MVTLNKGDYVMGGENHNSHGCMVTFPDEPEFEGMPKNGEDRRFMAMPAYLGGNYQMAGMKWYGSNTENKAYIDAAWIKKGALVCMPSAARFDESFYLDENTKLVVDNYKLYEAWADEYPYPTYDQVQIVGGKFMDLLYDKKITRDEIIDIADVIAGRVTGRDNDEQRIIYSVGGMPVEDISWGETVLNKS